MNSPIVSPSLGATALLVTLCMPSCDTPPPYTPSATTAISSQLSKDLRQCQSGIESAHRLIQRVVRAVQQKTPDLISATNDLGTALVELHSSLQTVSQQSPGYRVPRSELMGTFLAFNSAAAVFNLGASTCNSSTDSALHIDPIRELEVKFSIFEVGRLERSLFSPAGVADFEMTSKFQDRVFLASLTNTPLVYPNHIRQAGEGSLTDRLQRLNIRGQKLFGNEKWVDLSLTWR